MALVALLLGLLAASILPSAALGQESRPATVPADSQRSGSEPTASGSTDSEPSSQPADGGPPKKKPKKPKPRPGIPIDHPLLVQRCAGCHTVNAKKHMTRVSFLRKSPEGWSTSIKRMVRLYNVTLTPEEARDLVRYLATDHGLTRGEAKRSLYESERRVHWSEEHHDEDLRNACSKCHTLGRVFSQHRDKEEWELLRATHLAYFPLSSRQVGGRPEAPRDQEDDEAVDEEMQRRRRERRGSGDRVLKKLAADQPLFTPEWESWKVNRREIPLAGTWAVVGHQVGRGDLRGTVEMAAGDARMFETRWDFTFADGERVQRSGKGLLYAGFSWRGRSSLDGVDWREVLLLDEDWRRFEGRVFTGDYAEIGADVELYRLSGAPQSFAIDNRAVRIPSTGHLLEIFGDEFRAGMTPADFYLGKGVTVQTVEFVDVQHVRVTIAVDKSAEVGERLLSFGLFPGRHTIRLYDAIDYVRIAPYQGLARIGGGQQPKQYEQFELLTMHRGEDGKPFTDDDVVIGVVAEGVRWSLTEFFVRDNDDDVAHVGAIDSVTGRFTPAIDGPNPERKWQANNVGEVYVVAEVDMTAPVRAPRPPADPDSTIEVLEPPPVLERRTFRARTPLLVAVPRYIRFQALDWEDDD